MTIINSFKLFCMLMRQKWLRWINRHLLLRPWYIRLKMYVAKTSKHLFLKYHQRVSRAVVMVLVLGLAADSVFSKLQCQREMPAKQKHIAHTPEHTLIELQIKGEREVFEFYKSVGLGGIKYAGD